LSAPAANVRKLLPLKNIGQSHGWRVGVDIGGTFTDVALIDEASGEIGVAKVRQRRAI